MVPLEKSRQLKLFILVFQDQIRKSLFHQEKLLLILKILWTRREILFKILGRLIDQYVVFIYTETILRNAIRKTSCRRFVRNQGWCDTVVNNYSDKRFKYTFRLSRNTFTYILENIPGGLQKQIVIVLSISPELRLVIC